jgi:tRNA dimethylallyltransferase
MKNTCIVITGPTAVGKTALAIELANYYNTAIISADARQCFKELHIGVAKPSALMLQTVPHYFINTHSIQENMNAALFEQYSLTAADTIFKTQPIAIMVGGTGLYIKAFCQGMDSIPAIPTSVRENITTLFETNGLHWLQEEVKKADPYYYATLEIQNPQRLIRALEVKWHTNQSIKQFQAGKKTERPFNLIKIGLELPREKLYHHINARVEEMIQAGLMAEVQSLTLHQKLNALQTVGYKELFDCINGTCSFTQAVDNIKKNTRQYAKRQLTWFKKDKSITWFEPEAVANVKHFLDVQLIATRNS